MKKPDLYVSYMRTAIPLVIGWVVTGTGWLGIHPDPTALHDGAAVVVAAVYYAVFRGLEHYAQRLHVPWLRRIAGVLLGWARPPEYPKQHPEDGGVAALARRSRGRP